MSKIQLHIGIDDTDSPVSGCTTYTGTIVFQRLVQAGFEPLDFPWLVRLNPNIPWKTRGNGAVSLHLNVEENQVSILKQLVVSIVESHCDFRQAKTDPGIIFTYGPVPSNLRDFARSALDRVVTLESARRVCKKIGGEAHLLKGSRGMIGALAAIGACLDDEETFEIIAYRSAERYGKPRLVDSESVVVMDKEYGTVTFNNLDPETGRVLICPHGPDPVLFGIRGNDPISVVNAAKKLVVSEPIETICIFRTNAGTDAHLTRSSSIGSLSRYQSVVVTGLVQDMPRSSRGGHVFFRVADRSGSVTCAAFRPTARFRTDVLHLVSGDIVRASGGVQSHSKYGLTLNLEKLELLDLADSTELVNPLCRVCGTRCESVGVNQGYRCRKCSNHYPLATKVSVRRDRLLEPRIYMPPPRAHRHLTKPQARFLRLGIGTTRKDEWKEIYANN